MKHLFCIALLFVSLPAYAYELPTICGRNVKEVRNNADKMQLLSKNDQFISYADNRRQTMWTLTTHDNPAYPAVICRHPVREVDSMVIHTEISCDKGKEICEALAARFKQLDEPKTEAAKP